MGAMQPPDAKAANLSMLGRPLILIGASVRAAAQSAKRAGFPVTGIDLFGDVDTREACDHYIPIDEFALQAVERLHQPSQADLMVVGGLDRHDRLIDEMARQYPRLGPNAAACDRIGRQGFLSAVADKSGVRVPPSDDCGASLPAGGRWLIKDPRSSGGLAVRWGQQRSPAERTKNLIQQQWVPGRLHGATFLSDRTSVLLLGICSGRFTGIGPHRFVYAGSFGPVDLGIEIATRLKRLAQTVVAEVNIKGLFNIDFILNRNNVYLLEVNPRWSGSSELIERSMIQSGQIDSGESLIAMAYRAHMADINVDLAGDSATGASQSLKRIIYSRRDGHFDSVRLSSLGNATITFADVPTEGQPIKRGEPILTMIADWSTEQHATWQAIRRLIARVQSAVV